MNAISNLPIEGRLERFGPHTLILGDCRKWLPGLTLDAIVSDPPYGQKQNTNVFGANQSRDFRPTLEGQGARATNRRVKNGTLRGTGAVTVWPSGIEGDDKPFDPAHLLIAAPRVLLWGAHRFHDRLPLGSWLVWDKVPTGKVRDQGDGEAAWVNDDPPRPMRIYRLLWDGVCVGSAARHEVTAGQQRVHPTQKPVALMRWCIDRLAMPAPRIICDPYMGAGSTGLAAIASGHQFIGIEIEPLYFDTACRRMEEAMRQPDMFVDAPAAEADGITEGLL